MKDILTRLFGGLMLLILAAELIVWHSFNY